MKMKACLLCLEIKSTKIGTIEVNSIQWQTENVIYLIEKHLWPMTSVQPNAFICLKCWQELKGFHKFYLRVAKAHANLDVLVNADKESLYCDTQQKIDCNSTFYIKESLSENNDNLTTNLMQEDSKDLFEKDSSVREQYEPEILLGEPLPTDFVIEDETVSIKMENEQDHKAENLQGKHKEYLNIKDPLNKEKTYRKPKNIKETIKKSCNSVDINPSASPQCEKNILESPMCIDSDGYSDKHSDSQVVAKSKKKRKNPDEKTGQEYDKFIADNFQIVCSLCHVSLKNFIALRKHFRDDHKKRGFVICCKKKIFSRPLLVDHIHIHLDPNYFKCQQCDKVYSERSTLESHIKIHEMDQQKRNHVCDTCGKTFVGLAQLENHKRIHEPGYEKQFPCGECGKLFTTSYSLNYHIQAIHHNKFVNICDICGKTMRCRNQFKLHMEKHKSKESMSMNCDICGLRLTDRRGLRRHKNSQHPIGGKKEYSCHLCPKVSPNQEALRTHIRLTHSTSYNHKCTMCDKAFKRPYALREHMATHTGTALYTCPWCPKTFISNGNMHNHRKKAHPQEWEEAHRKKFANNLQDDQNLNITEGKI